MLGDCAWGSVGHIRIQTRQLLYRKPSKGDDTIHHLTVEMLELTVFDPQELVVLLVALGGVFPLAVFYRERTRLLVLVYAFLLVGAVSTNLEALVFPDALNLVEHGVGYLGVGLALALFATRERGRIRRTVDEQGREEG